MNVHSRHRVVIVGGGFAELFADAGQLKAGRQDAGSQDKNAGQEIGRQRSGRH